MIEELELNWVLSTESEFRRPIRVLLVEILDRQAFPKG